MNEYLSLVQDILEEGTYEQNRTKEETIARFGYDYSIDVGKGYPLLTTKQMDTFRWDSMLHEVEWYLSGQHHIRDLSEKTGIWNAWSDEDNNLPSAYGRFWRRYPVPSANSQLSGEAWMSEDSRWTTRETTVNVEFAYGGGDDLIEESISRIENIGSSLSGVNLYLDKPKMVKTNDFTKVDVPITVCTEHAGQVDNVAEEIQNNVNPYNVNVHNSTLTFDQLGFVVDALNRDNRYRGPESRRLLVQAWHPSNAQASTLPPCHYTFGFNVQNDKLNLHLTQRSADTALGVPFNIASYTLILKLVANQTNYDVGQFSHTLIDAHIYCGRDERSSWYEENISELQERVALTSTKDDFKSVRDWVLDNAPSDVDAQPNDHSYGYDHVPGLLEQLSREPKGRSQLDIEDGTTIENVEYGDFTLRDYESYDGIGFSVAE